MPFTFDQSLVLTPRRLVDTSKPAGLIRASNREKERSTALPIETAAAGGFDNQFFVFQLNPASEGPAILEATEVTPSIDGSAESPDVLVSLEMLAFHLGGSIGLDPKSSATMRINFGKDESSTDRRFDTVFWSVAAGLKLYNEAAGAPSTGRDFRTDIQPAFGRRPIEIYGGLGRMSFEVVKHPAERWWESLFRFGQSETARQLVSVLGFPAISTHAISLVDQLLNRFQGEGEILFKSRPMRLALTKYARDQFLGGSSRVRMGCLNSGFCVMARGADYAKILSANVIFDATYGKLVPLGVNERDFYSGELPDPLADVTYAVFRVGMKSTALDPTFNFS